MEDEGIENLSKEYKINDETFHETTTRKNVSLKRTTEN